MLLQCAQRTDRDQVARRDDRIERLLAREQLARGFMSGLLHRDGIALQRRRELDPCGLECCTVATVALEKLRIVTRRAAEERNAAAAELQQVLSRFLPAMKVVAADRE